MTKVKAAVGPVDILVNSAGIMEYGKMINCNLDHWLSMVNVNCTGFLNITAAVLPHMKSLGAGHIINITSDAGKKVSTFFPPSSCEIKSLAIEGQKTL